MEVSGQFHAPAALLRRKIPWYPLDRRWGGPQFSYDGGRKYLLHYIVLYYIILYYIINYLKSVLRPFRPRKDEISEQFRILHKGELCDLYRSRGIVKGVNWRGLHWARHVARMGIQGFHTEFWCRNLLKNVHLEDQEGNTRVTLKLVLGR
jgi:hypothetical protein